MIFLLPAVVSAVFCTAGIPVNSRCDDDYDISGIFGDRLSKPGNHLTIISGRTTEEKEADDDPSSKSTFAGLWKNYLANIWNKPFADRAKICGYNYMNHEDIMRKFAAMAISNPTQCPPSPDYTHLTAWHP